MKEFKIVKKKRKFRIIESRFPRRNRRVNIDWTDLSRGEGVVPGGIRRQSG